MAFYLQTSSGRYPLRDLGITSATLTRASFTVDTLELRVNAPIDTAPRFAYGDTVSLFDDATRRFTGRVTELPAEGEPGTEMLRYVVSGPWYDLELTVYQNTRYLFADANDPSSARVAVFSPRVVLFNTLEGAILTAEQQAVEAITYAVSQGAALQVGTIDLPVQVMWEEAEGINCAEVMKKCCRWSPDVSIWFDYTVSPPALNLKRLSALDAVTLDLLAADKLVNIEVEPNAAAVPPGVGFFFEETVTTTTSDGGSMTRTKYSTQTAGNPNAVGAVIALIELGGQGTDTPEPIPSTLAADYFSSLSTLNYKGRLTLKATECDGTIGPAQVLNLTGGRTVWATMRAGIQRVAETLATGETVVTLGQSPFLGAGDFADYIAWRNQKNKSNYLTARRTGEGTGGAESYVSSLLPDNPGDYSDALTAVLPGSTSYKCRTRGGTATLIGFSEFVASIPPKKFLRSSFSGSTTHTAYSDSTCGSPTGSVINYPYSGYCEYDLTTGALTDHGHVNSTSPNGCRMNVLPSDCIVNTTASSTNYTEVGTNSCCLVGGQYAKYSGSVSNDLSNECTEEDAISRLIAGVGGTWGGWSAADVTTLCAATRESRGAGDFDFNYTEAQIWITATGLTPSTHYVIKVRIGRTDLYGDPFSISYDSVMDFNQVSNLSGVIDFVADLPKPPSGFALKVIGVDFSA